MGQDAVAIKEKILSMIRSTGPNLPVFIAHETGLSILFASAFLSELIADKRLKISNMHVGSSPLYLIPGQEPMLENFSQYLKNKEKEAYLLLKDNKFLVDRRLEPAIRVALRTIKDFAIPFKIENEILWRYFTIAESDYSPVEEEPKQTILVENLSPEPKELVEEVIIEIPKEVIDKRHQKNEIKKSAKKPKLQAKKSKDNRNKFFNKIKESLSQKHIEIIGIEEIGINKIIFKVKEKEEYLIIAYNKKKIAESDIINAYKKSQELKLPYKILILGEPLKKLDNLIDAIKDLKSIEKVE
ncbi:MAG: hypothetical protein WAU65_00155 [Candidatus Nanoarchaeia archaeon]